MHKIVLIKNKNILLINKDSLRWIIFLNLFFFSTNFLQASEKNWTVPERMNFCGIELTITPGAREEIKKTVDKLTVRPEYHKELQRRISIFMPWVEDALKRCGMPEDLKYLVIQESAFVGDAVSSSNAVGFWQFKDFTAREMGLIVNESIDERKHLYKSTIAAAKYFYQNNRYFDNYLYSVIAYYAGGGGSMNYINPSYFGTKKMTIDADFHWYPLKALAHKIVFEEFIQNELNPEIWLEAKYISPGQNIQEFCKEIQIHPDSFKKYNLWMLKSQTPTSGKSQVAFIPRIPEGSITGSPIHNGKLPELIPAFASPEIPIPQTLNAKPIKAGGTPFHLAYMLWDEDFRNEYIYIEKPLTIKQAAASAGIQIEEFKLWNKNVSEKELLIAGTWYRKSNPNSSAYWISKDGDTWASIAQETEIPEKKLRKLNRVKNSMGTKPEIGRKIFLQEKSNKIPLMLQAPAKEKSKGGTTEYYSLNPEALYSLPTEIKQQPIVCQAEGKGIVCKVTMPETVKPFPPIRSIWLTHEVRKGEEIWALAKKYDTRGDLIRKLNQLGNERLRPGMKLKLFITETL